MKSHVRLTLLALVCATGGCFADSPTIIGCDDEEDCSAGEVCDAGTCRKLCDVQADCEGNTVCGAEGFCTEPADGEPPVIEAVEGNDPGGDASLVDNGIVVRGAELATAVFELRGGDGTEALDVVSQTDDRAELYLPIDVRSGTYTLAVTNAAGSATQDFTLQLPDLDGDEIVRRINDESSSTLNVAALPTGTDATTVALGDHLHDGRYYTQSEVDAAIAAGSGGTTFTPGNGLDMNGSILNVDYGEVQARVVNICPSGQAMIGMEENGAPICQAFQELITGTCPVGQAVVSVGSDGSVGCEANMVIASYASQIADTDLDATAAATTKTFVNGTITIPAQGSVLVMVTTDLLFSNASLSNPDARLVLRVCTVPDTTSDETNCGTGDIVRLAYNEASSAEPQAVGANVAKLDFASGGQKDIYFNVRADAGDLIGVFRAKFVAFYVPTLSP